MKIPDLNFDIVLSMMTKKYLDIDASLRDGVPMFVVGSANAAHRVRPWSFIFIKVIVGLKKLHATNYQMLRACFLLFFPPIVLSIESIYREFAENEKDYVESLLYDLFSAKYGIIFNDNNQKILIETLTALLNDVCSKVPHDQDIDSEVWCSSFSYMNILFVMREICNGTLNEIDEKHLGSDTLRASLIEQSAILTKEIAKSGVVSSYESIVKVGITSDFHEEIVKRFKRHGIKTDTPELKKFIQNLQNCEESCGLN